MKEYYLTIRVNQQELETAKATFQAGSYSVRKVELPGTTTIPKDKDKVFLLVSKK